jgi:hypothetical protein
VSDGHGSRLSEVICHCSDAEVLGSIAQVCCLGGGEDGRAGIVVWNVPERSETFGMFMAAVKEVVPDLPPPPQPPAVFSLADPVHLEARMRQAGFRDVEIRQFQGTLKAPSPSDMWHALADTNPVMPGLLWNIGSAKAEQVKRVFMERVRGREQGGEIALLAEAHIAVGHA